MALKSSDKQLIDDLAKDLRTRFQDRIHMDGITREKENNSAYTVLSEYASAPVAITKQDLRDNSGRQIVRDAYLSEVAAALNEKPGIIARADFDQGLVLAQAVPDFRTVNQPMSINQLKAEAERSAVRLADDDTEDES